MDDVSAISVPMYGESGEPDGDTGMTIGAFARRSRLSPKALRLYDRLGLLTPDDVHPVTGYRSYRANQLTAARLIGMLRRLDMPLATVAEIVHAPADRAAKLLAAYWHRVELRIASQRELAAHLKLRLSDGEERRTMYDVLERDVPEQLVLTEQRHILVDDLPAWMDVAMTRLAASAQEHGGMVGPPYAIFHGEVNHDSDGPVEVCFPIDPARESANGAPMRREAAHRQAYVRLRKAQVAYPQILSAFDAVAQWLTDHGYPMAAAPREIYFVDFKAAGPDDEVCDVAFPFAAP